MATNGPFPSLKRFSDYHQWRGKISLPSLAACYVKWAWSPDNFFPSSRAEQTKRPANFYLNDESGDGPDEHQQAAMEYLAANEAKIAAILLDQLKAELLEQCRSGLTQSLGWLPNEVAERNRFLASVKHGGGIAEIVALSDLFVYKRQLGGCSYLGFTFSIGWDWEHSWKLVLHKDRIVDSGDAGSLSNFEENEKHQIEGEPVFGYYG